VGEPSILRGYFTTLSWHEQLLTFHKCKLLATEGVAFIIQYIENGQNPDKVCSELGLCSSKAKEEKIKTPESKMERIKHKIAKKLAKLQDEDICGVCQGIITIIERFVQQNSTEKQIEWTLENLICNNLSPEINATVR
jgi:hypothetical protein